MVSEQLFVHAPFPQNPVIPAGFTDAAGHDCGRYVFRFLDGRFLSHLIDNTDLGDLLHTIAACAMQGTGAR